MHKKDTMINLLRFLRLLSLVALALFYIGCSRSYIVPISVSPAQTVYSINKKIEENIVIVFDKNINNVQKNVKPSSYACSIHNFPVNLDKSLALSIKHTTELVFNKVVELDEMPSSEKLQELNSIAVIYVKLKKFYPEISFVNHIFANCVTKLDVYVTGINDEKLLAVEVGGFGESDGSPQGIIICNGGELILSEAISNSIKDTMEKYATILSNSSMIRGYFEYHLKNKNGETIDPPSSSKMPF
ncbi:MAG: hypothetical protein AAB310_00220 [Nitrospirota bacterium]